MYELTILMPCLNEAETIEVCVRKARAFLERSGVTGEVLIADNGSTDGSQALATAAGARVVPVSERGYGAALLGGIRAAQSTYIAMGDADDSYDFSNLMPFLERLRAGEDLVMGNRFKGGIEKGAMPFLHKYLGNPVLSFLGRLFFNINVRDFHCGLRAFNRDRIVALNLVTQGMEFASEMVVKSAIAGYRISEVPTTLKPDGRSRPPHLRTWRDGWRHLRFLLVFSPRYLYVVPGMVMLCVGLAGTALLYNGPHRLWAETVLDVHSFIAFVLMSVLGVQVLLFGALSRVFASTFGIRRGEKSWFGAARNLELQLIIAGLLLLGGLGGALWCVGQWAAIGYADLNYNEFLRPFVISLAAVLVGAQVFFTAFFSTTLSEFIKHRS
ncbi:glycosyltransferase family 2 protein [Pseudoxanthomonas mexicana]|uniref:glycosyltransferase family 2 protein n=1 Tax=Pseudoxanthomonas mexicana TaxID=128785 RepID=UPI0007838DD4|nr:glycosyltransferase family 2 protein [Pseudoxanthomonas mexicana]